MELTVKVGTSGAGMMSGVRSGASQDVREVMLMLWVRVKQRVKDGKANVSERACFKVFVMVVVSGGTRRDFAPRERAKVRVGHDSIAVRRRTW